MSAYHAHSPKVQSAYSQRLFVESARAGLARRAHRAETLIYRAYHTALIFGSLAVFALVWSVV